MRSPTLCRASPDNSPVRICANCGEENPDRFRLCGFCGTPFEEALPPQETRKTVTVVFTDVTGSTGLGENLDPEAVRRIMERYFETASQVLTRHGGTVEKFIGDAVMAVFGVPRLHEDDPLRAVRAAVELQAAMEALNAELEPHWGITLHNRTGVNTGEVVAGDPPAASRWSPAMPSTSPPGWSSGPARQVLLGEATYRLVAARSRWSGSRRSSSGQGAARQA